MKKICVILFLLLITLLFSCKGGYSSSLTSESESSISSNSIQAISSSEENSSELIVSNEGDSSELIVSSEESSTNEVYFSTEDVKSDNINWGPIE